MVFVEVDALKAGRRDFSLIRVCSVTSIEFDE